MGCFGGEDGGVEGVRGWGWLMVVAMGARGRTSCSWRD